MGLLYRLTLWSNVCVRYMDLRSNGYFVTSATMFDWLVTIGLISLIAWTIQSQTQSGC
jgi:hypothetical protein